MASNKFFTIMVVPEKSHRVAKIIVPNYVFKGGILAIVFLCVLATIMVLDYANVMNQINENKQLKTENRQLRQSVQIFKTKMVTMENTLDRVKTFVTKLRIITNIEDTQSPSNVPIRPMTPATLPAIPSLPTPKPAEPQHTKNDRSADLEPDTDLAGSTVPDLPQTPIVPSSPTESARAKRKALLAALMDETLGASVADSAATMTMIDTDTSLFVKTEFEKLSAAYDEVNQFALSAEQETQDILEKLGEKRSLLASTPTRIPTFGYITSEYGVRISPYDGRRKMHEGIDIANRFGADIVAPADGVVAFAGVKPGYGKLVILDHGNGLETRYAHNSRSFVNVGARVRRGQRIAAVGNTGHSTGPHCHYEVHANGLPVDPCWYILDQPALCRH